MKIMTISMTVSEAQQFIKESLPSLVAESEVVIQVPFVSKDIALSTIVGNAFIDCWLDGKINPDKKIHAIKSLREEFAKAGFSIVLAEAKYFVERFM